ncbi:MAG TPA: hypothetical protein VK459_16835 [Polyangiaceae bacterium]|jgi:hypothetical protein|nr:hypothetical protein [Polyangiaceae bacterium]
MASDPKNPVVGDFVFDGSEFKAYAEDLPPGACQGMLTAREGFLDAAQEILTNHAAFGAKAGVPDQDAADLATCNERIARIDVFLPALCKAIEVLTETRYVLEDRRQRIVLDAAKAVDRRAIKNPELLARYEKARAYRSAAAKKAVKTKEKNAAAEQAPAAPSDAHTDAGAPPTA